MEHELVRTFEDSVGIEWEVREIHVPSLAIVPRKFLPRPEFADGWLLFTCGGERRRLAPCPGDWRAANAAELVRWCGEAVRVIDREPRHETLRDGAPTPTRQATA